MFGTGRAAGVTVPEDQLRQNEKVEPNKLLDIFPMIMYGTKYSDEYGRVHVSVLVGGRGKFYHAPNGEQWAAALKEAAEWLDRQINSKLESDAAPVPTEDVVDVVSSHADPEAS
jgi:methionine aminopeptidase